MSGKILIVDDVPANRIILRAKLGEACYKTFAAADGDEAMLAAARHIPDAILLSAATDDGSGLVLCRRLARTSQGCAPIIVMSETRDPAFRLAALRAGAEDVLARPLSQPALLARLRSVLRARDAAAELRARESTCRELGFAEPAAGFDGGCHVALVTPGAERGHPPAIAITAEPGTVLHRLRPSEALAIETDEPSPDAFVIAARHGDARQALRLMTELRSRPPTRHAAMLIALPENDDLAAMALDLGASDLVGLDASHGEIRHRLHRAVTRKRLDDRLRASVRDGLRLALCDPLTGLYNRRYAMPHLGRIAERAWAAGRSFAVMALDIDHFKRVNDHWGHAAGDAVLVAVAARLKAQLRAVDLLARVGGEEFLVALPDTGLVDARKTAERLRSAIETRDIGIPGGAGAVRVTMSVGLALGGDRASGPTEVAELVARADRALLAAKTEGRNQVTISAPAA